MKKQNTSNVISKFLALTMAFFMFGNVALVSAAEIEANLDITNELEEEVMIDDQGEESKEESSENEEDEDAKEEKEEVKEEVEEEKEEKEKDNQKNVEKSESDKEEASNGKEKAITNGVDVVFEGTANSNLKIDESKINVIKYNNVEDIDVLGYVTNTSTKTYSFTVRAKFYDINGNYSKYDTYDIKNLRSNEKEAFEVYTGYCYNKIAKVELYIENVTEIYDNNNEKDIKVEYKNIEYSTNSSGGNRKTIITANITNNSDYLVDKLGVKFVLRDSNSKPIQILESTDITNLGVGETREVKFEGYGIFEDHYKSYEYNIGTYKRTDYKIEKIKLSKSSPQYIGKSVVIETIMDSSYYSDEYKYYIYKDGNLIYNTSWSSNNKATWTPNAEGDYKIKVEVRSSSSSKIETRKTINYKVVDPKLGNLNVSLDKKSPQAAGSSVKITASSSGESPVYKYEIKKGSTVVATKDYSTAKSYNWVPSAEGTYTINVYSRNSKYKDLYLKKTFTFKVTKPVYNLKSLTINKKSPQATETVLTLNAAATGSNLQYRFSYHNGKKWTIIKDYSSAKSVNWKPTVAGKYKIKVDIKVKGTSYTTSKTVNYEIFKKGTVTIKSLTANKKSPQPQNASIKLTTSAIGSNLEYKYMAYNGKKWVTLRNYSSNNTYVWKPTTVSSKYKVRVYVRTKGMSKAYTKDISYNIFKRGGVSITSLKSSKTKNVVAGDSVNITASAKGSYLEYRFYSYSPYTKQWYLEKDWSKSKSFKYITWSTPGTNYVKVQVRQRGCTKIYSKTINFKVHAKPSLSVNGKFYTYTQSYNKYLDYGYYDIVNNGNKTLKITKLEMITNGTVVYKYSPSSFKVNGYGTSTLWYSDYDNEKSYSPLMNSSTYWKMTYTYDGLTHVICIYQK